MISVEFLRHHYFPHVSYCLEPVHDAGIRTVWHSDGDIRPIIEDVLACGVGGFQGFQEEYGVDIADIASRRTRTGEPLTIFAGPSVTRTLPFGTVEDVREEMERIIDTFSETCALFISPTSNVLPDCPLDNVIEAHRHAIAYSRRR
jgi:uroporphyrinogen-III decarboxylase